MPLDLVWKKNQRRHAVRRLKERYGFSEKDFDTIRNRFLNGTYEGKAYHKSKYRDEIHMKYKKQIVIFIVDYFSNEIVTFFPSKKSAKLIRYKKENGNA